VTLIHKIARRTGLYRNTVRKHLKSSAIEPRFATPEQPNKLVPFAEKLAGWLNTEAGKGRKQRPTLKQRHADLGAPDFVGSDNRVAALPGNGWQVASAGNRRRGGAPACRCCSSRARPFSSTGARMISSAPDTTIVISSDTHRSPSPSKGGLKWSVTDTIKENVALFMMPGLDHCGLLPGPGELTQANLDPMTPLKAWLTAVVTPTPIMAG
jgi:hypothetical protein